MRRIFSRRKRRWVWCWASDGDVVTGRRRRSSVTVMSGRTLAVQAVAAVVRDGRNLDTALMPMARHPDRGFIHALAFETVRWYPYYRQVVKQLLDRPLRAKDVDLEVALVLGMTQLGPMGMAVHAALNETVAVTGALGKAWAGGMVNAVLRRFTRELDVWRADEPTAARRSHPEWMVAQWQRDWPAQADAVVVANNHAGPMTLRVNRLRTTRAAALQRLDAAGIAAQPHPIALDAVQLAQPRAVERLPGFEQGDLSVQDAAAQLATQLLAPRPGMRVLDACAAPGGKTGHIAECLNGAGALVAVDVSAPRQQRVRQTLDRLGLNARLLNLDATAPDNLASLPLFDRILLDAPCSAAGVIRRHPDIKLLRRESDLAALAQRQAALLRALWSRLAFGGELLYVTCSTFKQENEAQIQAFLTHRSDARSLPIAVDWGWDRQVGRQLLPGEADMDGFFYARLAKCR